MSYSHSSHRQDIIGQEGYDVWYFILPMYAFFTSCFIKYTIVKKPFLFLNVYNQFIFIKLNNAHKHIKYTYSYNITCNCKYCNLCVWAAMSYNNEIKFVMAQI